MPTLYYDLGSPYAYLAAARVEALLGPVEFQPVLVGGIFKLRGRGSWAHTPEREANVAEVEARARRYGLPPVRWPDGWPNNTLAAMRAAIEATRNGHGRAYAMAGFRLAFVEGRALSDLEVVAAALDGLTDRSVDAIVDDQRNKDELRRATDTAWAAGVAGVPSVAIDGEIIYGDDRLSLRGQTPE